MGPFIAVGERVDGPRVTVSVREDKLKVFEVGKRYRLVVRVYDIAPDEPGISRIKLLRYGAVE
jgi:hypothetical protein